MPFFRYQVSAHDDVALPHDPMTGDAVPTDASVDEQRTIWRRAEDQRGRVIIAALATGLVTIGIAWGTATQTVAQKVDRAEFAAHVAQANQRFMTDSLARVGVTDMMHRIESKLDSTNARLSQLICDKKAASCR